MPSFPPPITAMKLRVSTGTSPNVQTFEQTILPSELSGTTANSVLINDSLLSAFSSQSVGTSFSSSIVTTYESFPSGNILTNNNTSDFIPIPITITDISLAANGVTIRYTPPVGYTPPSFPFFIQANPRGRVTGPEWFAVVDNSAKSAITSYAGTNGTSSSYFTSVDSGLVPFNNIVTTLMTDMSNMFFTATTFNQPIGSWDTSNVTNMSRMFYNIETSHEFNQNIGLWNTSNVTDMSFMFRGANQFNNDNDPRIDTWDVSKVTSMYGIFARAISFNQSLNSWNTSNVVNMRSAFQNCTAFNGNISSWNTSSVTNMSYMFYYASVFNQPLNLWNTSNVTNMSYMFFHAYVFNQPLNLWNTSNVTYMNSMFSNATAFNQPINTNGLAWNTSNVTAMSSMFVGASAFNQPLNSWDTSNVTDMGYMFENATAFNQDISSWQVYNLGSSQNKPANFDTGATALLANPSYPTILPNWAMSAP